MALVTESDLMSAVRELSRNGHALVTSRHVKDWCDRRRIDWGQGVKGYSGRHLNEIDKRVCQCGGRLQRWKKKPSVPNSMIGWSLTDARSIAQARQSGWVRVCWDPNRLVWNVLP